MDHSLAREVTAATRRTRWSMLCIGCLTLGLGLALAVGPAFSGAAALTSWVKIIGILFGGVFLLTAACLIQVGRRTQGRVRCLEELPERGMNAEPRNAAGRDPAALRRARDAGSTALGGSRCG